MTKSSFGKDNNVRSNKDVIFGFMITRYDEFDATAYEWMYFIQFTIKYKILL